MLINEIDIILQELESELENSELEDILLIAEKGIKITKRLLKK
ncbi:MAG: hypothetical protein V3U92_18355 [Cellulophaga sp.]